MTKPLYIGYSLTTHTLHALPAGYIAPICWLCEATAGTRPAQPSPLYTLWLIINMAQKGRELAKAEKLEFLLLMNGSCM